MKVIPEKYIKVAEEIKKATAEGRQIIYFTKRQMGRGVVRQLLQTEDINHITMSEQPKFNLVPITKDLIKSIFDKRPDFKAWIESTQLFNVIVEMSNGRGPFQHVPEGAQVTGTMLASEGIQMSLKPGVVVNTVYDLPVEMIEEFYRNSPFYKPGNDNSLKLIENK